MKKFMFAVMMVLSAGAMAHTTAHSDVDVVKNVSFATDTTDESIMRDECASLTQMVIKKNEKGISFDYVGTNEEIHQCVYMKEVVTKECVLSDSCVSYSNWTAQNKEFDVTLPRYEFTKYFQMKYVYQVTAKITMETVDKRNIDNKVVLSLPSQ